MMTSALPCERSSVTALRPLTQPPSKWPAKAQATVPLWSRRHLAR
jgi:hypothetical protein